jgi:hypothetical protein
MGRRARAPAAVEEDGGTASGAPAAVEEDGSTGAPLIGRRGGAGGDGEEGRGRRRCGGGLGQRRRWRRAGAPLMGRRGGEAATGACWGKNFAKCERYARAGRARHDLIIGLESTPTAMPSAYLFFANLFQYVH